MLRAFALRRGPLRGGTPPAASVRVPPYSRPDAALRDGRTVATRRTRAPVGRIPSVAAASQELAVLVDGLNKQFRLPQEQMHTLKERALHPFRRQRYDTLHALGDVSFDVRAGEFYGIVGRNGSGKSTLLKCLAGIYAADSGEIWLEGRL